jgi:hypothetical protein
MKLGEVIQRVQSLYSRGVQSDDSRLSSRHIYNKLLTVRTRLISQKSKKKQKINDWNYQTISCIEMIDIQPHECPCAPAVNCTVKRSRYMIPKVMTDYNNNLIDYVMTIDSGDKFDFTNKSEMLHINGNKYTASKRRYLIDNDYLFAYGKDVPQILQIRALFEDPIEAVKFTTLCSSEVNERCIDIFDMEFPMDGDTIDIAVQLTSEELIVLFKQNMEDVSNDTGDIPVINSKG